MEIILNHARRSQPRVIICEAPIPLCYLNHISNGAVKKLAKRLHITTLEELYEANKEHISNHIKNVKMRKEIFALQQTLKEKVRIKRTILRFDELAAHKNIKIKPLQRNRLAAVEVFAKILKNIGEVITFLLDINNESIPYREKAILTKIYTISLCAIKRNGV